ncbi:hypothetical protein KO498_02635 [Lentibacter algarum]|uniref:hypothetical protein n=1 Tax=Lentibacter algarum TaxID=576131 RepID=UPI001C07A4E1|nr:hypothetical protein [Lentibacter algarum]MBU2980701.1 hypothetical protein [Lentibacter algarum]
MLGWIGNTITTVVTTVRGVFGERENPPPDVPPECEDGECPAAIAAARAARRQAELACVHAQVHVGILESLIKALTPTLVHLALLVVLVLALGPLGLVAALGAYMALLALVLAWSQIAAGALASLATAASDFQQALDLVRQACSQACLAVLIDEISDFTPCNVASPQDLLRNAPFNDLLGFSDRFN